MWCKPAAQTSDPLRDRDELTQQLSLINAVTEHELLEVVDLFDGRLELPTVRQKLLSQQRRDKTRTAELADVALTSEPIVEVLQELNRLLVARQHPVSSRHAIKHHYPGVIGFPLNHGHAHMKVILMDKQRRITRSIQERGHGLPINGKHAPRCVNLVVAAINVHPEKLLLPERINVDRIQLTFLIIPISVIQIRAHHAPP